MSEVGSSYNPPSSGTTTTGIITTTSDIATFDGTDIDILVITDEQKGGTFLPYAGSFTADNGVVFTDVNGDKWKRQFDVDFINVKWYNVVENVAMDAIFAQILAAASSTDILPFPRIYFPANTSSVNFYTFASTVTIDTRVEIFGDGDDSKLRWAVNIPCIVTNYTTSRYSVFKDFLIDGGSSAIASGSPLGSNWSILQHGLNAKDIVYCKGLVVRYCAGNGFNLVGSGGVSNVNNCRFEQCLASQNRLHGYYIQGADANAIQFLKCDAISNGATGWNDLSFLGNHYLHNHSASNGSPEITWQRGLVKSGTDVYACKIDGTVGIEPGVTVGWETNWDLLTSATYASWDLFASVLTYNATRLYYIVCAYNLEGVNQYGTFIGNYAESDQAPSFIGNRNVVIDTNAPLRTGSAATIQSNVSLYSTDEFWAGNPGDFTTNRSFIAPRGVGVTKTGGTGMVFGWDSTRNMAEFKALAGIEGSGSLRITSATTTAANAGRTAATVGAFKPWFPNGILVNNTSNRSGSTKLLDFSIVEAPSSTNSDIGDVWIGQTTSPNLSVPPEVAVIKRFNTTSSAVPKTCPIKGYMEDTVTTVGAGTYTAMTDYNVATNRGILYNIQYVGSDATNDCILHREILCVNRAGTVTVTNNVAIRPDVVPGAFSATAITLTITGSDDIVITITGLPASTNGKVNIKRINY